MQKYLINARKREKLIHNIYLSATRLNMYQILYFMFMQNNCEKAFPVRVVRGHQIDGKKVYTYDGLYKVSSLNTFYLLSLSIVHVHSYFLTVCFINSQVICHPKTM